MEKPITIYPEKPAVVENPSSHQGFRSQFPTLWDPLQTRAYELIKEARSNLALIAPTSSGKTLAVSAALFESRRPTVFVYPFRALVLDQTLQLVRIANAFGFSKDDFGQIMGGTNVREITEAVEGKNFVLATPDKLVTLLSAGDRTKHGAMIAILRRFNFVLDEVHVYNSLMLTSLKYFIRSVREFRPQTHGFYFLSATFPEEIWRLLRDELGMSRKDKIEGKSYAGRMELIIQPAKTSKDAAKHIARLIREYGMDQHCVCIFNTPLRAWQVSEELDALLFIGQDKMSQWQRSDNLEAFEEAFKADRSNNILCGSPAIEAGVDFKARNLVIEESYADSFIQRFGRGGRAGQECKVLILSDTLYALREDGALKDSYERSEFLNLLDRHCRQRQPTNIFNALAAYAYYQFWRKEDSVLDPHDRDICRTLDEAGVDYSPFRGFIPFTQYEVGGQKISYKTLLKRDLPILSNGKVKGAPSPERYFRSRRRPPVLAEYLRTALEPEVLEETDGAKRRAVLAKVRFHLGKKERSQPAWTVLDIDLTDNATDNALESARGDDNLSLKYEGGVFGWRTDGTREGRVRFFEVDA